MRRLPLLAVALSLAACAGAPSEKPTTDRPLNVLFIAVDDLRPTLGTYGHRIALSPKIDALATRSVRFDRAYCQYPLCNPSRASILSGRLPTTTGILDNTTWFRKAMPDVVSLPQLFRENGYVALRSGKIYHGGLDDDRAWTEGGEALNPPAPRTPEQNVQRQRQSDRWEAVEGEGDKLPDFRTATKAIELLERHQDRPFFLAVGFVKPHSSYVAPKKHFDRYDVSKISLPTDFAPRPQVGPGVPAEALSPNGDVFIGRDASEAEAREVIRAYYACVSWMDEQTGRVLDALDRLGLRENTVVVFWGDHGYHLGEKGKWSKHNSLYEVGTRVPLLVALPDGRSAGRACARTVELLDLYPTLAELAGLKVPPGLEGRSLVPLLQDPGAAWDKPARSVTRRGKTMGKTVRTERWRYTEWDGGATGAELYDHAADPHELKNLAADPAHAAVRAELRARLP
jgi:arylsulfatase A-like enzyme